MPPATTAAEEVASEQTAPEEAAPKETPPVGEALASASMIRVAEHTASADPTCNNALDCNDESCCRRIVVPALAASKDGKHAAVKAFALDKYELTVGRVRRWDEAGAPTPRSGESIGNDSSGRPRFWLHNFRVQQGEALRGWKRYDTWTVGAAALPKNNINWYTAAAVCHYAGGRLPTDAELRVASIGGDEDRPHPWGDAPQTPKRAIYNCSGDGDPSCSLADIPAVGSRPAGAGRWGHMDLRGSLFEWSLDAAGGASDDAVSRGGGFCYIGGIDRRTGSKVSRENTRRDDPITTSHMVGARCAYDIEGNSDGEVAQR